MATGGEGNTEPGRGRPRRAWADSPVNLSFVYLRLLSIQGKVRPVRLLTPGTAGTAGTVGTVGKPAARGWGWAAAPARGLCAGTLITPVALSAPPPPPPPAGPGPPAKAMFTL